MNAIRALSIRHIWIALTVAAAFIGPASSPIHVPDVYWTLLAGSWMFANGRLLESDPFTAAPHVSGRVLNVQWLAGVCQELLGATAARLVLIDITGLASNQFLVLVSHGPAADPFVFNADMNMIELGHDTKVALAP